MRDLLKHLFPQNIKNYTVLQIRWRKLAIPAPVTWRVPGQQVLQTSTTSKQTKLTDLKHQLSVCPPDIARDSESSATIHQDTLERMNDYVCVGI